jgi:hypothetical protein
VALEVKHPAARSGPARGDTEFHEAAESRTGILALRRRSGWEAADSGFLIWRKNFFILIPFFALPVWITAFVLRILPFPMRFWHWLALWFLKPLFDRAALQVISVRFFEPRAGLSRIVRGLWKNMRRGLPGDLLWRRLSPWRPVMLSVRMLEQPSPGEARKRKKALVRGGIDFCVFLTVWGLSLEAALLAGESFFVLVMVELFREDYFFTLFENTAILELFLHTAWCINYMVLEAIYVCMGFSLYINSRVETEGWDIELTFRKLAAEGKKMIRPGAALIAGLMIFAAGPIHAGDDAALYGQDAAGRETARSLEDAVFRSGGTAPETEAGEFPFGLLEEILSSGDFGGERENWGIRLKNRERQEETAFNVFPWVEKLKQAAAWILRLVLILAAAAGVACALWYLRRHGTGTSFRGKPDTAVLTEPGEENPEVFFARARFFHEGGLLRQAWAHCLAGTLAAWKRRGVAFPPDATEYDCLALVRKAVSGDGDSGLEDLARLIGAWVAFAYGGRTPPAEDFEVSLRYGRSLLAGPGGNRSEGTSRG